eukprot:5465307-Alexandrium_andersonii.AAC.1
MRLLGNEDRAATGVRLLDRGLHQVPCVWCRPQPGDRDIHAGLLQGMLRLLLHEVRGERSFRSLCPDLLPVVWRPSMRKMPPEMSGS